MSPSVGIDIDINEYTGVIVSIYDTYYKYTNCFYASPFSFNRLDSDSHAFINATLESGVLKLRGSSGNYYCKLGAWLF